MGATEKYAAKTQGEKALLTYHKDTLYRYTTHAHFAAFLELAHYLFVYRKHFCHGVGGSEELLGDFWLPQTNTFVTLFPTMPSRSECMRVERTAALGHNIVVLVGECCVPVADTEVSKHAGTGWRGWRIRPFGSTVEAGHVMWLEGQCGGAELTLTACPYDKRACTPAMEKLYSSAVAAVSAMDSDPETEPDQ